MIKEIINKNDANQRLDRFLKKAYKKSSLSYIYKLIRKDVKVNGKRQKEDFILQEGDEVILYISQEEKKNLVESKTEKLENVKKQFSVVYENDYVLLVEKPFGLLVHGDKSEKKATLANQVISYLIATGSYEPKAEKTFVPAPSNRLDRNTTGIVIFGKTAETTRLINEAIRTRESIRKFYMTIVKGELQSEIYLKDWIKKDQEKNKVSILNKNTDGQAKEIETKIRPIAVADGYTLVEVEIPTGRTHQIRSHLQKAGYPLIGDPKYGDKETNKKIQKKFKLNTQILHAYKLIFDQEIGNKLNLDSLQKEILPTKIFLEICQKLRLETGIKTKGEKCED